MLYERCRNMKNNIEKQISSVDDIMWIQQERVQEYQELFERGKRDKIIKFGFK